MARVTPEMNSVQEPRTTRCRLALKGSLVWYIGEGEAAKSELGCLAGVEDGEGEFEAEGAEAEEVGGFEEPAVLEAAKKFHSGIGVEQSESAVHTLWLIHIKENLAPTGKLGRARDRDFEFGGGDLGEGDRIEPDRAFGDVDEALNGDFRDALGDGEGGG